MSLDVLDIDSTDESPNPPLYAPETCPTDSERNDRTLKAEQISIYTVNITVQRLN